MIFELIKLVNLINITTKTQIKGNKLMMVNLLVKQR